MQRYIDAIYVYVLTRELSWYRFRGLRQKRSRYTGRDYMIQPIPKTNHLSAMYYSCLTSPYWVHEDRIAQVQRKNPRGPWEEGFWPAQFYHDLCLCISYLRGLVMLTKLDDPHFRCARTSDAICHKYYMAKSIKNIKSTFANKLQLDTSTKEHDTGVTACA